jgi:hypothetical protein
MVSISGMVSMLLNFADEQRVQVRYGSSRYLMVAADASDHVHSDNDSTDWQQRHTYNRSSL